MCESERKKTRTCLWPKTSLFLAYYTSYIMYVICECASEIPDFKNRIILIGSLYSKRFFFLFSFDHKIKQGIVRMRDVPFLFSLNVPLNTTHTNSHSHSHSHSYTIQMDSKHILSQYQFHQSIRWLLKVFGINTFPVIITCVTSVLHQSKVAAMVSACEPLGKFTLLCVIEFW